MQASHASSSMDSGFISGDPYMAIHIDYLDAYLLDDLSDVIDSSISEEYQILRQEALRDPDWAAVADYLYITNNQGDLIFNYAGDDEVVDYVETLEFGGIDSAPNPLLRRRVVRAANDVSNAIADYMRKEVALG